MPGGHLLDSVVLYLMPGGHLLDCVVLYLMPDGHLLDSVVLYLMPDGHLLDSIVLYLIPGGHLLESVVLYLMPGGHLLASVVLYLMPGGHLLDSIVLYLMPGGHLLESLVLYLMQSLVFVFLSRLTSWAGCGISSWLLPFHLLWASSHEVNVVWTHTAPGLRNQRGHNPRITTQSQWLNPHSSRAERPKRSKSARNHSLTMAGYVGWLVVLRLNVPVNNFSVMSGRSHRFLGN